MSEIPQPNLYQHWNSPQPPRKLGIQASTGAMQRHRIDHVASNREILEFEKEVGRLRESLCRQIEREWLYRQFERMIEVLFLE